MTPGDLSKERVEKIDKIFVKTNYHRSLFPKVPDEKFVVVGNGIDLTRFEGPSHNKDPWRFCYTSSPNRGLEPLLMMWPWIKKKIPEATLHVYYGWKTFYEIEKGNPERMQWMKKMQELMKQDGVIDHGRVGQKELAQDLLKTSFWLYPTFFPEIDCITAKEMQAAGVIPITSGYAALEESQKFGPKIEGDVWEPEWQYKFVSTVESFGVATEDELSYVRKQCLNAAKDFDWDIIATNWDKELCESDSSGKTLPPQDTV
jgi:glycosyltransferase involved in cell wall biosynthesis